MFLKPYMSAFFVLLVTFFYSSIVIAQQRPAIEWVELPASTYQMGSDNDEKLRHDDEKDHTVTLRNEYISSADLKSGKGITGFKISKFEVTFDQYDAFCDATGKRKPFDNGWGRGSRPVINVSWKDANDFAIWMGCRLPTEAEWEYACKAGSSTMFNTGIKLTTDQANIKSGFPIKSASSGVKYQKTIKVGSYPPNAWGLCDMHGNVWEWCSDWYDNYNITKLNPAGPETGTIKVIRGGAWDSNASQCRSAARSKMSPKLMKPNIGIRLVTIN